MEWLGAGERGVLRMSPAGVWTIISTVKNRQLWAVWRWVAQEERQRALIREAPGLAAPVAAGQQLSESRLSALRAARKRNNGGRILLTLGLQQFGFLGRRRGAWRVCGMVCGRAAGRGQGL